MTADEDAERRHKAVTRTASTITACALLACVCVAAIAWTVRTVAG